MAKNQQQKMQQRNQNAYLNFLQEEVRLRKLKAEYARYTFEEMDYALKSNEILPAFQALQQQEIDRRREAQAQAEAQTETLERKLQEHGLDTTAEELVDTADELIEKIDA